MLYCTIKMHRIRLQIYQNEVSIQVLNQKKIEMYWCFTGSHDDYHMNLPDGENLYQTLNTPVFN